MLMENLNHQSCLQLSVQVAVASRPFSMLFQAFKEKMFAVASR